MSDALNRRKFARIPLETRITVVFGDVEERRKLWIENLGEGGLFLRCDPPKPVGSKIRFEFPLRGGGPVVCGTGVVQWVNRDPDGPTGMGIQFLELNEAGRREIEEVLRRGTTL